MIDCINDFIGRAYGTSCRHGFHDEETGFEHQMMLVVGEVGELVEADRKCRHANVGMFERESKRPQVAEHELEHWSFCFDRFIKDTMEDELADVCIRLFDMCGCFDIHPMVVLDDELRGMWRDGFGSDNICEVSFSLVRILCDSVVDDLDFGCLFVFIELWAEEMGIDLDRHIELKMRYNENRGYKHGKKY